MSVGTRSNAFDASIGASEVLVVDRSNPEHQARVEEFFADGEAAATPDVTSIAPTESADTAGAPARRRIHLTTSELRARMRNTPRRQAITEGQVLYARDGVGYIASRVTGDTCTFRRALPKIRGKQAQKGLKRERQRARLERVRQGVPDGREGGFDSSQGAWSDEGLA